ncbi:DUF6660 family protein [Chitinophaga barathri]|uniref:Cobalt transporter n=1 Tax=Chitinophaga barathri TaxID=1647451 RepID=A0A3N4M9J3_9BACT|nr:DUF6660 family protein [Chitinophaga barathri]RPD38296.1 hypothetical protein EG028_25740 [Chitinophaga barathri]
MKWLMILFSLYILALSAVPCCGDDFCCEDEVMAFETGEAGHEEHDHNKPDAPCSPFFSCNTCHGVVVPDIDPAVTPGLTTEKSLRFYYTEHFLSEYATAIWQPPQAA